MYRKKTCKHCQGTGKAFNFAAVFDPANWVPFHTPKNLYVRCQECWGRGYVLEKWRTFAWRKRR
jgi:DnaJ-class molecular chaperone